MNVLRPFWIIVFCVGIVVSALAQERWQPFKLHPDVQSLKLIYDVKTRNNAPVQYGIDVRREGEGMVRLKVETEADLPEDQLGVQSLFGLWNIYGISAMVFLNPGFVVFFSQLDLKVGEKMSFFGAGYAKVTGKKKVARLEGYVVEFYQQEGGSDVLKSRFVIHPKVFLPLESTAYGTNGKVESTAVLKQAEIK